MPGNTRVTHPDPATLALHAGGDLGRFAAWRTERHLGQCAECREEIAAYQEMRAVLPELNEVPDLAWDRLAHEMQANIRLGLAAGECVREASPVSRPAPLFAGARLTIALASVAALVAVGVVLQRPTAPIMSASAPVVQRIENGIEARSGEQGFALLQKVAATDKPYVSHTAGAEGTMGERYVDPETDHMTVTKLYVDE